MGKLLTDIEATINNINQKLNETLTATDKCVRKYEDDYVLNGEEFRDPDVLKERMKEKINLGICNYDRQ